MLSLEDILSKLPIFSSSNRQAMAELAKIAYLKEYKKGQIIYAENSAADNLYIVISGRVKTYTQNSLKQDKVIEFLYRGTCFGIISLLTNRPHSVTAEAANDSLIIQVAADKFNALLDKNLPLSVEFSKLLSRRVKKEADKDKNIFESTIIAVHGLREKIGKTSYSLVLAKALLAESRKKVIVVELKTVKEGFFVPNINILDIKRFDEANFGKCLGKINAFDYVAVFYKGESSDISKAIHFLLSFLTQDYNFIILDLPSSQEPVMEMFLKQSDIVHFLVDKQHFFSGKIQREINAFKSKFLIKEDKIKIIIRQAPLELRMQQIKGLDAGLPYFREKDTLKVIETYPQSLYAKTLRRIARQIAGVRIGLALGSGAAFGFAHVGVLKVLEENNIDVDIIAGSSVGAVIAALWAMGKDWKQIKQDVLKFKKSPVLSFWDFGFSKNTFLKGRGFRNILKEVFGNTLLQELKRPALVVCFDFTKREARVFSQEKSLVREAVLASCSIPGIFEPLQDNNTIFFDGGILNPLPAGFLVKDGVRKIISVNVTPSKEEVRRTYAEDKNKKRLNVFDFIFGSVEAMQLRFIEEAISLSDVVIHPEFKNAMWTDFKQIDYFIQQGEVAALKHLPEIKRLTER